MTCYIVCPALYKILRRWFNPTIHLTFLKVLKLMTTICPRTDNPSQTTLEGIVKHPEIKNPVIIMKMS